MRIVICVKQIQSKLLFEESNNKYCINPFDYYAVEQAVALRKQQNVHITALMMGLVDKRLVVELGALGCNEVIYLSDGVFAGADTLATSYILAKGLDKIADYDFVFCGDRTLDGETGHIGPSLSERLQIPYLGNVTTIEGVDGQLNCTIEEEYLEKHYHVLGKSVISFKQFVIKRTKLSLMQLRRVEAVEYTLWNHEAIGANPDKCGIKGSKTKVISAESQFTKNKNTKYYTEDIEEKAKVILTALGGTYV